MNNRFKLALKLLNYRREKGFALVLTFAVGAIMVLTGAAILARAANDQSKVAGQKDTLDAAMIAENGLTQYSNFLNNNRILLTYPSCAGTLNSSGVCPDSGTAKSWANVENANILPSPSPSPSPACPNAPNDENNGATATEISTTWANKNGSGWINSKRGRFRLIGYEYYSDGAANTAPGKAKMIVEGQTLPSNPKMSSSAARIGINFPVTLAPTDDEPPIPQSNPGLWARSFDSEAGGADVHANVLDSSGCNNSGNNSFATSRGTVQALPSIPLGAFPNGNQTPTLSGTVGTVTQKVIPFPPLPAYPTTSQFATLVTGNKVNQLNSCAGKTNYPANGDYDSKGTAYNSSTSTVTASTYIYRITGDCTLPSGVTFGVTGGDKVIMYIDSTFVIKNNATIKTTAAGTTKVLWLLKTANLDLEGNAQIGTAAPTGSTASNWAFFLYNGTSITLNGANDYYAFIFAPNANADLRGTPKIGGALWVKSYQTKGTPPKVFQAINQEQLNELFRVLYSLDPSIEGTPLPQMTAPTGWERLEIPSPSPSP